MKCLDLCFAKTRYGIEVYEKSDKYNKDCNVCGKEANLKSIIYIHNEVCSYVYLCDCECIELNIQDVNFSFNVLERLKNYDLHVIPNHVYYHIGKTIKMGYIDHLEANAYRIYHKTCDLARRTIREFCLYCIRYEKDKVNRDIRRKICQLIWEDKIKFLI